MDTAKKKRFERLKEWFSTVALKFLVPRLLWAAGTALVTLLPPFAVWRALVFPWVNEHRQTIFAWSLLPSILSAFVVPILLYNRSIKRELLAYKSITKSCGIEGFWHFTTEENKDEGWSDCNTKLAESPMGELCIAGLTGAHTFADPGSPLRQALEKHQGPVRILLIDRDSRAFQERIKDMAGDDPDAQARHEGDYRNRLDSALRFCVKLAEKHPKLKSIEVRAYDRPAIWKMVIFGNYLWLQHYVAGKPGSDAPAYMLSRGGTLSHPMERVFEFRWGWAKDREKVLLHRDERGNWIVHPGRLVPPTPIATS